MAPGLIGTRDLPLTNMLSAVDATQCPPNILAIVPRGASAALSAAAASEWQFHVANVYGWASSSLRAMERVVSGIE